MWEDLFQFWKKFYCGWNAIKEHWCYSEIIRERKSQLIQQTFSPVQSFSRVWFFATPWTAACQASLFITNSQSLLKFMSIELMMPSNHLILCHPLLLPPSIFPSIKVFSSSLHQMAKVLEFQLQHQSFQWIFRTDFLYSWLVWSLCSPRESQESSLTPHFKSIYSSALSFLYNPTLTFIYG